MAAKNRRSIADLGLWAVLNQTFRTLLHTRLRLGIQKLRMDPNFKGDVLLIEPTETDARFFSVNPIAFWKRATAAQHGFESVSESLTKHHHTLKKIFNAYGIAVNLDGFSGGIDAKRPHSKRGDRADEPHLRVVAGNR